MKYQMINPKKRNRTSDQPVTFDLDYNSLEEFREANQHSLRRKGTVVFGPDRLDVGEELLFNLKFKRDGDSVQIRGRVVWVKEYAGSDSSDSPTYGIGIRYDLPTQLLAEEAARRDDSKEDF